MSLTDVVLKMPLLVYIQAADSMKNCRCGCNLRKKELPAALFITDLSAGAHQFTI